MIAAESKKSGLNSALSRRFLEGGCNKKTDNLVKHQDNLM